MSFFAALLLVINAAASAAPARHAAAPPRIGQLAPGFTLRDQNRRRVSLAEAAGTKAVLVFYRGYW